MRAVTPMPLGGNVTTETRTIAWQRDVDAALADAEKSHRPLLLDFTAAPQ